MGIEVKICGLTSEEGVDAALRAGADYLGFNFHPRSPRHVPEERAAALAARARARARIVALLVDPSDTAAEAAMAALKPDFLQLHGEETPGRVAEIALRFAVRTIKVLPVAELADLAKAPIYEQAADMLLFDAKPPRGAARPGGHGTAFDWRLLADRRLSKPWLLAGGLDADNVARAIAIAHAPGVDVASGVERAPGVKDPQKIAEFVAAARGAQYANSRTESPA